MYYQVIQIDEIDKDEVIKDSDDWKELYRRALYDELDYFPRYKYVILDRETAEKYGLESDITAVELFDKMTYYNEEVVDKDIIKKCVILDREAFKEKKIEEFYLKLQYDDELTCAFNVIK